LDGYAILHTPKHVGKFADVEGVVVMPYEGAIKHPSSSWHLQVRPHYVDLCGDHCSACILSSLEYWHNHKLADIKHQEARSRIDPTFKVDYSLWVYKSEKDLSRDIVGLFGEVKIREAIKNLTFLGFISARSNPRHPLDRTRQYSINTTVIQGAIDSLSNSDHEATEKPDASHKNVACNTTEKPDASHVSVGCLKESTYREEENTNREPLNPQEIFQSSTQSQNQNQSPEDGDSPFTVAEGEGEGEEEDPRVDSPRGDLVPVDEQTGAPAEAKPKKKSQWGNRKKEPKADGPSTLALRRLKESASAEADTGVGAIGEGKKDPTHAPTPRQAPSTPSNREMRVDYAARWDTAIPDCPVNWNDRMDSPLERNMGDPDLRNRFDEVVAAASQSRQMRNGEAEWLTFRWLFGSKLGRPNWWRLLSGELAWMRKSSEPQSSAKSATDRAIAMIKARRTTSASE
jgi:hypothetical protein